MRRKENTLTRVEFEVMSILWSMGRAASAWDVLQCYPEPRPAYTTVSTNLKVLCEKGYVEYYKVPGGGKAHHYQVLLSRAEYTRRAMQEVKRDLFGGSLKSMFSYFLREEELTEADVAELLALIRP